jgi:cold shock CspA family protein
MTMRGTVKWFDNRKQYGWIAREDGQKDLFFGRTSLPPYDVKIEPNTIVVFDVGEDRQGRTQARNVRPVQ